MGLNLYQKGSAFFPVAAGQKAATRLPTGPTYRSAKIGYVANGSKANEATCIADIEEVTLKINNKPVRQISGRSLVAMNKFYNGGVFNDGELVLDFSRHWMRTEAGEDQLALGTANVRSVHIEVKVSAGATAPELTLDTESIPEKRDLGFFIEQRESIVDTSVAGRKEIQDLATTNGSLVALHLFNANITALQVKIDKLEIMEDETDLVGYHNELKRVAGRTPQTGYTHFDALKYNRLADAIGLASVNEFFVNPTLSAAGSIPIVMETVNTPLGLNQ